AIAAAEAKSSGEIVAVATPISDAYHDVALHWALVPLFAVLAWAAWRPTALAWWYDFLFGGWSPDPTQSELLTLLMVFAALKFAIALLILKWMPLRLFLTPGATKHRRVRRRAIRRKDRHPHLFVAGRTTGGDHRRRSDPQGHRRPYLGRSDACASGTGARREGRRRHLRGDRTRRRGAVRAFSAFGGRLQRDTGPTDRAMNLDDLPPPEVL